MLGSALGSRGAELSTWRTAIACMQPCGGEGTKQETCNYDLRMCSRRLLSAMGGGAAVAIASSSSSEPHLQRLEAILPRPVAFTTDPTHHGWELGGKDLFGSMGGGIVQVDGNISSVRRGRGPQWRKCRPLPPLPSASASPPPTSATAPPPPSAPPSSPPSSVPPPQVLLLPSQLSSGTSPSSPPQLPSSTGFAIFSYFLHCLGSSRHLSV